MARPDEADELYGVPLDEFVAERTALAKRLRSDGRRDDAAEVAGLRRPSVAAWAVNQLARRRPDDVRALLAAADRLRSDPGTAADDVRTAVDGLVRAAGDLLEEAGHSRSDATLQKVATTLRAAAAGSVEQREALERGTLERELEPSGFDAMAALAGAAPPPKAEKPRRDAGQDRRRERIGEAERALAEAKERARDSRREADDAERAAARARREAERAEAEVEKAERALERARA